MATPPTPLPFFFLSLSTLSLLIPFISSSPTTTTITLPLTQLISITPQTPSQPPHQKFSNLAFLSQNRAHHIKNPKTTSTTPLSPRSYGGYSISLSFGTPSQTVSFIMDTGSDFVWFPCTRHYTCRNCSFPASKPPAPFIPKASVTAKVVGCLNPKCGWVHDNPNVESRCRECLPEEKKCTEICPPYLILYGSGSTGGISIVDNLNLPGKKVPGFLVGCSLFSTRQPAGIAGFGRGPTSFPTQLGLKKFSYCLLSHKFDDSPESTSLVLYTGETSHQKTTKLSYTPLLKNPQLPEKPAFSVYYYVGLRQITVGGKKVKIPYKYLSPSPDGNGGTIVDSGTTFTYLNPHIFDLVTTSFITQISGHYKRMENVEKLTGLRPCYDISGHRKKLSLPELKLHFKGGAEMGLPLANYFSLVGDEEVVCLTMVTDADTDTEAGGPAVILGNYQLQNFYTEFDLGNERFGFRQQLCI